MGQREGGMQTLAQSTKSQWENNQWDGENRTWRLALSFALRPWADVILFSVLHSLFALIPITTGYATPFSGLHVKSQSQSASSALLSAHLQTELFCLSPVKQKTSLAAKVIAFASVTHTLPRVGTHCMTHGVSEAVSRARLSSDRRRRSA